MIFFGEPANLSEDEQRQFSKRTRADLQNDGHVETRVPKLDILRAALTGLIPPKVARQVIDLLDDETNKDGGGAKLK